MLAPVSVIINHQSSIINHQVSLGASKPATCGRLKTDRCSYVPYVLISSGAAGSVEPFFPAGAFLLSSA